MNSAASNVLTPQNQADESYAAAFLAKAWRVRVHHLYPPLYWLDWAIFRGDELATWAEYKRRSVNRLDRDSVILSAAKWEQARALAQNTAKPFTLVVGFNDCCTFRTWKFYEVEDCAVSYPIRLAGTQRGARPNDIEPCLSIPIGEFSVIGGEWNG